MERLIVQQTDMGNHTRENIVKGITKVRKFDEFKFVALSLRISPLHTRSNGLDGAGKTSFCGGGCDKLASRHAILSEFRSGVLGKNKKKCQNRNGVPYEKTKQTHEY